MMGDAKDLSIHQTALKICEDLQLLPAYSLFYSDIQKLVSSSTVKYEDFKGSLVRSMQEKGLESELRNNVYHWLRSKKREAMAGVDQSFFRKVQLQWDKRVHKSLNSMCGELGITLAKLRQAIDRQEIEEKWKELSNYEVDISKYRPVYAPKDFLEILLNLNGPNYTKVEGEPAWDFSHIPLKVKDLADLRALYSELARGEQILGLNMYNPSLRSCAFEEERIQLGKKVLHKHYAPIAQEYLKKGCPRCLRARMWTLVLGAEVKPVHYDRFRELKESVLQIDLMIDKLIIKDIHLTASNDDQYFVFEDVLYQVMLCFSRDADLLRSIPNQSYMQVTLKGRQLPEPASNVLSFPPSGVIPFHGFTMYAAPFCYLFHDPVPLYYTFRAFYIRYWHRLHRICGHPQGIVSLCLLFERLLQCYEPTLWHHFKQIHISPIKVVFKWLMRAFSGHLPPEQLLQLWDLILAYDSLEIISYLAAVILIFRKKNLMKVSTLQNIEAVLADLSSVAVIPLLQISLLKD